MEKEKETKEEKSEVDLVKELKEEYEIKLENQKQEYEKKIAEMKKNHVDELRELIRTGEKPKEVEEVEEEDSFDSAVKRISDKLNNRR